MKRLLLISYVAITHVLNVYAQDQVRGRITDVAGRPIPKASVKLGTSQTTLLSDSNGFFNVRNVHAHDKLFISYVGYQTKIVELEFPLPRLLEINLQSDIQLLDEVEISTGFQSIPKERITGSFDHISNETFNEQVSTDIIGRLESIANGFNVDRATRSTGQRMTIRGLSTISGESQPLIVVDNFPYEGDISNLNPNDVSDITILKDAAASSIWGTRAGNGVIVITTKHGKLSQPLKIETNNSITLGSKPDLFYLKKMSSTDYIEVERFLFSNKYRFSDTSSVNKPAFTPAYEVLFRQLHEELNAEEANMLLTEFSQTDIRNEFNRYMYQDAVNQQYALNMSGGTQNASWYFSAGHDRNADNLDSRYRRYNLNFSNSYIPAKWLAFTSGLYFTQSNAESGRTGYTTNNSLPPYTKFADDSGFALPVMSGYRQPYIDTIGNGLLLDWNRYVLDDYKYTPDKTTINDLVINVGTTFTPLKWLKADIKYQYEQQRTNGNTLYEEESYFTRNLINQYTQLNQSTGILTYKVPPGSILDLSNGLLTTQSLRGQLDFDYNWGKNEIVSLLGGEVRERKTSSNSNRTYGYDPELITFGKVDFTNTYPVIVNGRNSYIPDNSGFSDKNNRFISGFANAAYTFDKRYILSISARRDASNLFGVNTNDKWNLLWSAGGGWNMSNESFYKLDFIPYLKFRVTYGFSGNVDLSRSAVTTISYTGRQSPYTLSPVAIISQNANPDLRWEKVKMINFATDFSLKGGILSGSIDYYVKNATDLFGPSPMDFTTGLDGTITKNVASIKGHGLDVELNSINVKSQSLGWTSNLNFSFYRDKISDYYKTSLRGNDYVTQGSSATMTGLVGKPLYSIYSYRWQGLDPVTGDPVGYINGKPSKNYAAIVGDSTTVSDLIYSGSALPVIFGSLGNTWTWKNFSLTTRILYKLGYYYRKQTINYSQLFSVNQTNVGSHPDYQLRWQKPGDELITDVPSMVYPANTNRDVFSNNSEIMVEKGDNIRLQYITLAYDLNKTDFHGLPFKQLRMYVNVDNIGIIWRANNEHIDPDYGSATIPPSRSVAIGFRLTL